MKLVLGTFYGQYEACELYYLVRFITFVLDFAPIKLIKTVEMIRKIFRIELLIIEKG